MYYNIQILKLKNITHFFNEINFFSHSNIVTISIYKYYLVFSVILKQLETI